MKIFHKGYLFLQNYSLHLMPRGLCFLLALLTMYPILFLHNLPIVLGSPSFARYELRDQPHHDWKLLSAVNETFCKMILQDTKLPDLDGISYTSDGKTLNATFWLHGQFRSAPANLSQPNYAMGVILTDVYPPKVDYVTTINYDMFTNWTKKTVEILNASGDTRILENNTAYSGFFDNGDPQSGNKGHVTLSLDLARINSPEQFILFFLLQDFYQQGLDGCLIADFGDSFAYVPPPKFTISADQTTLRPGQEKIIDLRVNSNIIATPKILLGVKNQSGITLNLLNDQPYLNTGGFAASLLKVKVWNNATSHPYAIPVYANISFPQVDVANAVSIPSKLMSLEPSTINTTYSPSIPLKQTILTINVLQPLTPEEQFESFWKSFGGLIALVGGGFAAGFSALVFDKLKKKRADSSSG
jgi:hypothetical protein